MSRTIINVGAVISAESQINSAKAKIGAAKNAFVQTKNSVDGKILNRSNIRNRLGTVQSQLSDIDSQIGRIRSTVRSGANLYRSTDDAVTSWKEDIQAIINPRAAAQVPHYWHPSFQGNSSDVTPVSDYVLSNTKIVNGIDYTSDFLQGRCHWLDAVASAWNSNWINNLLSLFDVGEDLNEAAVRRSIESLIKATLQNKHTATDYYDNFTNSLTPEEFKNFKKVVDYTVEQGTVLTDIELATLLNMDVRNVTECDYLQILRTQTDLDFFNSLSDGLESTLGAYTDAVEAIDVASQMIGRFTNDYSEDLIYLESIRTAMIEGGYDQSIVNQTINEIEWNYKNQAASAILIGVDKLYEEGANAALGEALPLLNLFVAAKDVGCIVSGLGDKTDNLEMIYSTQHYSYALIDKYEAYAAKIQTGDYSTTDVENCKVYFDLAKNAKIQEYEAMVNLYEGALDDVKPGVTTGVVKGVSSLFTSDAEEQAVADMINCLNGEIVRLKEAECYSVMPHSHAAEGSTETQCGAGGAGGAGGR